MKSKQSTFAKRTGLNLFQQQKMYRMTMADSSLVSIGNNMIQRELISVPCRSDPDGFHSIEMYRPAFIKIESINCIKRDQSSSAASNLIADFQSKDTTAAQTISGYKVPSQEISPSNRHLVDYQEPANAPILRLPFNVISRKKSAPRHRCSEFNRSVSSILKPSLYSPPGSDARLSQSLPPNAINHVLDAAIVDEERLRKSMSNLDSGSTWLPKGVDFALAVEVYYFCRQEAKKL